MKHRFPTLWDLSARVHVHRVETAEEQKLWGFSVCLQCASMQTEAQILMLECVCVSTAD